MRERLTPKRNARCAHAKKHGTCPVTGEPLGKDDLVELRVDGGEATAPIDAGTMSVPELLVQLKQQFDASALEKYELRKKLMEARKELSHSLYRYDAACRVIARLMSQKDKPEAPEEEEKDNAARKRTASEALAPQEQPASKAKPDEEKIDRATAVVEDIANFAATISALRKKRSMPADLIKADEFSKFEERSGGQVVGGGTVEISSMCCYGSLVAVGSSRGKVAIFDSTQGQVVAGAEIHHENPITSVSFVRSSSLVDTGESAGNANVLVSDTSGVVKLWTPEGTKHALQGELSLTQGSAGLVSLSMHASGSYFMATSNNDSWYLCDVNKLDCVKACKDSNASTSGGFTCGAFHPDGMLVCTGLANGPTTLWDVRNADPVGQLKGHVSGISSVSFSENGYHMATSDSYEDGHVRVWDLRKLQEIKCLPLMPEGKSRVYTVQFDTSGRFLLAGGEAGMSVYGAKQQWRSLCSISCGPVRTATFGPSARWLAAGSSGNKFALYGV